MRKLIFLFSICIGIAAKAQQPVDSLSLDTLNDAQLRMMEFGERMIKTTDEKTRLLNSRNFLITLSRSLRVKNSYYFKFDSLKSVSILYSPDNRFRIFTWNVALDNALFHNFGVIQLNPQYMKTIKDTTNLRPFYPLIDRSSLIRNALDTSMGPDFWYGAVYYQLFKVDYKKDSYYMLVGWNGSNVMTNKKVIEVLTFKFNKPHFGAPIFQMNEARFPRPLKRMVYEFNNQATMTLRFAPKKKYLIIENIVPPRPQDYGHPETYLPDGSYEYMVWDKGFWNKKGALKEFDLE